MNIESVVNNNLCTGCGICFSSCPSMAIRMEKDKMGYSPRIDYAKCNNAKGCTVCFEVCPGHSVDISKLSTELFLKNSKDVNIGQFKSCYTGYSTDYYVRYHSASGGVITQLLIFMLEQRLIKGALVTCMDKKNPLEPEVIVAKTKEEVIEARSSKYCPVPVGIGLKEIMSQEGKFAVVGLPCHIHGFRKAQAFFPELKKRIFICLGTYCSSTKSFGATEYLVKRLKIPRDSIETFAYRDEGCLGSMKVVLKTGETKKIPFINYYPSLRSFFIPFRCTLCIDHTAELADISFGDIYIPEYWDDKIGTTSIIVRSENGKTLLENAQENKYIALKKIDKELIVKSQREMLERKKKHIAVKVALMKFFRKQYPKYDYIMPKISLIDSIRYFVSTIILYFEIAIGNKRKFWPFIKWLDFIANKLKKKE